MGKRGKQGEKGSLDKWVAWVAIVGGTLGIIGWFLELPDKFGWQSAPAERVMPESPPPNERIAQTLSGVIQDQDGEPIPGVTVSLPDFQDATTNTNDVGHFELNVKAVPEQEVMLIAQKAGYRTEKRYPTLGNTRLNFILRRKP